MLFSYLKLADWASISEILLAAIALLALGGAALQIFAERSTTRETLTYNYTERFATPALLAYHQMTEDLFRLEGASGDQRYEVFQGWKYEDQLAALLVPNLFEELAGMYNQGLLHKKITKEFFGLTALDVWNRGSWFIDRSRQSTPEYYEQWELMLINMRLLLPGSLEAEI